MRSKLNLNTAEKEDQLLFGHLEKCIQKSGIKMSLQIFGRSRVGRELIAYRIGFHATKYHFSHNKRKSFFRKERRFEYQKYLLGIHGYFFEFAMPDENSVVNIPTDALQKIFDSRMAFSFAGACTDMRDYKKRAARAIEIFSRDNSSPHPHDVPQIIICIKTSSKFPLGPYDQDFINYLQSISQNPIVVGLKIDDTLGEELSYASSLVY